jgi:ABC-type glycerol-3-phosphate transport system permease component
MCSLDGAGPWKRLFLIYLPLSKPIIATVILFNVVWNWNAFFDGLVFMNRTEQYPLQTYIQQMVVTIDPGTTQDVETIRKRMAVSSRTLNAAKIVVTMFPILVIYPFLQQYFIKGIMLGSVKQ